jgi:hypothetical protein
VYGTRMGFLAAFGTQSFSILEKRSLAQHTISRAKILSIR